MRMSRLLFSALACTSLAANALTYVESTDLPNGVSFGVGSVSVGTLDTGGNSISGSLDGNCIGGDCNPPGGGDTQDSFLITVAAGTQLWSLTISNINTVGPTGFSASLQAMTPSFSTAASLPFIPINGTSGNVLSAPLAAGVYSLSIYGQQAAADGAYQLPYSLSLEVAAVPEPASALLLGLGGLLLTARRRRGR